PVEVWVRCQVHGRLKPTGRGSPIVHVAPFDGAGKTTVGDFLVKPQAVPVGVEAEIFFASRGEPNWLGREIPEEWRPATDDELVTVPLWPLGSAILGAIIRASRFTHSIYRRLL
ncbi:MAG: hypothetical protein WB116_02170, partial [Candidatus Dormiibacterota bacterium]